MEYGSSQYGVNSYGTPSNDFQYNNVFYEDIFNMMMSYLPQYYNEINDIREIIKVDSSEIGTSRKDLDDLLNQFFIDTATWGLNMWEDIVGVKTDESIAYEQRRSIIKAKIRGHGVTTKKMIINVASSFSGGEVEVTEDFENYSIIIRFISTLGVPKKIEDLTKRLEEILPAHLGFEYIYTYLVWSNLIEKNYTWGQAKSTATTWNDIKTMNI